MKNKIKILVWRIRAFFRGDCYTCMGEASWYGLAPHSHGNMMLTTFLPESEWPNNYYPLDENAGEWHCPECGGTGKRGWNQ